MNLYPLAKSILFKMDAEKAHHFTIQQLQTFSKIPGFVSFVTGNRPDTKALNRKLFGINFPNPIGLAAGLDKNAEVVDAMGEMGFGYVEVGTVTPKPQPGNDKPRLFRLPNDRALINRMGFNNVGADVVAQRLRQKKTNIIVGANIGKNKTTENEDAVKDYVYCFKVLFDYADYFVVNVSSPNTPGLRALQDKDSLSYILNSLQDINAKQGNRKPILLKIAPDLTNEQLDDVISVVQQSQTDGIVATNTTIARNGLSYSSDYISLMGAGGLSGAPLTTSATEVIKYLKQHSAIPVIGVGGIMNANDAIDKFKAGADLIQLYSGFIYAGPALISDIKQLLIKQ